MFKNIRNYIRYRKFIDNNKNYLMNEFNLKIDRLYRLGTKVSIPERKFEVLVDYQNSQLDIFENLNIETKKYISRLDNYLMRKNMFEFVGLYDVDRTDINEVTIIMSYKSLNVVRLANILRIMFLISTLSLFAGIIEPFYMLPGAFLILIYFLINKILFKKLFV